MCLLPFFYQKYNKYKTTGVIPSIDDNGIRVEAPAIFPDIKLKDLNADIETTVGYAEKTLPLLTIYSNSKKMFLWNAMSITMIIHHTQR